MKKLLYLLSVISFINIDAVTQEDIDNCIDTTIPLAGFRLNLSEKITLTNIDDLTDLVKDEYYAEFLKCLKLKEEKLINEVLSQIKISAINQEDVDNCVDTSIQVPGFRFNLPEKITPSNLSTIINYVSPKQWNFVDDFIKCVKIKSEKAIQSATVTPGGQIITPKPTPSANWEANFKALALKNWFNAFRSSTEMYEITYDVFKQNLDSLLNLIGDVNIKDENGETALMNATHLPSNGSLLRYLLSKPGIDVNSKDKLGRTALMNAVQMGNDNAVRMLLDAGADVNAQNSSLETPLWIAALYSQTVSQLAKYGSADLVAQTRLGFENIISLLLNRGANEELANDRGKKPIDVLDPEFKPLFEKLLKEIIASRTAKLFEFAKLSLNRVNPQNLLQYKVNIDAQDENGLTPLMWAASRNNKELVDLLLKKGARRDIKNLHNETAYDVAKTAGHAELASVLRPQ